MRRSIQLLVLSAALAACGDDTATKDIGAPSDLSAVVSDLPIVAGGPGATLHCDSSGKNAFDTYGVAGFIAINKAIFTNVSTEISAHASINLGDSFSKVGSGTPASTVDDSATFEGKLAAYLVWAYGGPLSITYTDNKIYIGPQSMASAHAGLGITSEQYDYFLTNVVVPALVTSGVAAGAGDSSNDVSSCFAPVLTDAAFKAAIVGK